MTTHSSKSGSELFIVDNSDSEWKVLNYLRDWCELSKSIDIATGYFEIGALLALKDEWQKVDHIRILMGEEVSIRTKQAFVSALNSIKDRLDYSIEAEKEHNDFLSGVPAIVNGIQDGKLEFRVYRKDKFHAKAYITRARQEVIGAFGLVGSSNLTYPGLTENIELNVQIAGRQVNTLQEWYDRHWEDAEPVTAEILKVIERQIHEYLPFQVYAKALTELFRGQVQTAGEWERQESVVFPILAKYQQDGYHDLLSKANRHTGAFLCDGVGLGKTFIGLMLIERLVVHDHKRVALFVPKAAREAVWEATLKERMPEIFEGFYSFKIFNHTDLLREKLQDNMEQVRKQADVIIIDEAHHFRNTGIRGEDELERKSRYWRMYDLCEGKQVFLLTATPVNNRLTDLQHMIELFSRHDSGFFKGAPLGIHSLPGHIRKLEKELDRMSSINKKSDAETAEVNFYEADEILNRDNLFQALVVQRSRAYVKLSMGQETDGKVIFPEPREPKVIEYSVKQTYGKILTMLEKAFNKENPLFSLPIYYPYAYFKGPEDQKDALAEGRQRQVVRLIRVGFLKRFESSVLAFTESCWNLLRKLLAWVEVHVETAHEKKILERWKRQHAELIRFAQLAQNDMLDSAETELEEDFISPEMLESVEKLSREEFKIDEIIDETILDLNQIVDFLNELKQFQPKQDNKLRALINLLKNNAALKKQKVLIFSEFMDTARYLKKHLQEAGIEGVDEVDSAYKGNRATIIRRFSPYYNNSSSAGLAENGEPEIRVLISTDVLSEGLNLQDATCLINYDLHWNPVRLMQRIGRVDRRMNPEIEKRIVNDHPDQKQSRGIVQYWNFLPPEELDDLLRLYSRVAHKTLRISKTFGIEGRKLLTPDDAYDDLKNFMEEYEGRVTPLENMKLELQELLKTHPGLEEQLLRLPQRVFSGKEHPTAGNRAIFFCYARPAHDEAASKAAGNDVWTIEAGDTQWYLYDIDKDRIIEEPTEIVGFIRSQPDTPRKCAIDQKTIVDARQKIDKHLKNTYLKKVQAPIGVKPVLKAWMELS